MTNQTFDEQLTDSQKLEEIIKTAIGRGFKSWWTDYVTRADLITWVEDGFIYFAYKQGEFSGQPLEDDVPLFDVLFNHDFAKAYFGEEDCEKVILNPTASWQYGGKNWQYHLQQCVLDENPINYYYEHK